MSTEPERDQPTIGEAPGRGTAVLVLGVVSLICSCTPLGIVAWIMGASDLKRIDRGEIAPEARIFTLIGMVLGIIATLIFVMFTIWYVLLGGWRVFGRLQA